MPRATSPFSRGIIIANKVFGNSPTQCLEQLKGIKLKQGITDFAKIDTIRKFYKDWEYNKSIDPQYSNCRNAKKYTTQEEDAIVNAFVEDPSISLRKAQENDEINSCGMSKSKIRQVVQDNGLNAYKIPTVQMITEDQKAERVRFAKGKLTWTQKWKCVLFSDECVLKKGKIGNRFVWYSEREAIESKYCNQKEKYPKQSIHVWGIISYSRPLHLQLITGRLDSQKYCGVLQNFIDDMDIGFFDDKLLQQDMATCHKSTFTEDFLDSCNIERIDWPPKGADLSPIERIWGYLKEEMNQIESDVQGEELVKVLKYTFLNNKKIQLSIKRLYESIPQKIQQIIQKKGEQINF